MNPEPSIAGAIAKIDRADENIRNLNGQFTAFINDRPYTTVPDVDENSTIARLRITSVADVPLRLRVLVGEIAHHLRSAFDLLIYQLLLRAGVSDKRRLEQCAFPVILQCDFSKARDRKKYEDIMRRKIEGIAVPARTLIEHLQPCKRSGDSSSPLGEIDALDNTDKHRLLLALIGSARIAGFNFPEPHGGVVTVPHQTYIPLEPNAIITAASGGDVDVNFKIPIEITFGEPEILWRQPVIPALQNLSNFARTSMRLFERFF